MADQIHQSEAEGISNSARLTALDGLRAVAIGAVFLVHFHPWVVPYLGFGTTSRLSAHLSEAGNVGVDVFLALSGYLIVSGLLRSSGGFWPFMRRRARRLYPVFLAITTPLLIVEFTSGMPRLQGGAGPLVNLGVNLTMLAGLVPVRPLNLVAWTLSWELAFYVVAGWCYTRGWFRSLPWMVRTALWCAIWALVCVPGAFDSSKNSRMLLFLAGSVVAEWNRHHRVSATTNGALRLLGLPALLAIAAVAIGSTWTVKFDTERGIDLGTRPGVMWGRTALLLALTTVLFAALVQGPSPLTRLLSWRPLVWMGEISYSFYLTHALLIRAMFEVLVRVVTPDRHSSPWWLLTVIPAVALALLTAWCLFTSVERPFSIRKERWTETAQAMVRSDRWKSAA